MEEPQSPFSYMRASGGVYNERICRLFLQEKSLISTYMCTNIPHQAAILPNMGKMAWIKILKPFQSELKKRTFAHHPVTM